MEIRFAKINEIDEIKDIYNFAKIFMNKCGNTTQWVNDYPQREILLDDIKKNRLFVCLNNNKIVTVFCFFIGEEPTYNKIYNGKWLNTAAYGVIHRIAVTEHNKGLATFCIKWCLNNFHNIKIDTHENNIPMQKTILKNGFKYCGIIRKTDGTRRLAYQSL